MTSEDLTLFPCYLMLLVLRVPYHDFVRTAALLFINLRKAASSFGYSNLKNIQEKALIFEVKNCLYDIIGASLSKPHINGTALCESYAYDTTVTFCIP